MCEHHIADDPTGLVCGRLEDHEPGKGCTYTSTSGVAHCAKEE